MSTDPTRTFKQHQQVLNRLESVENQLRYILSQLQEEVSDRLQYFQEQICDHRHKTHITFPAICQYDTTDHRITCDDCRKRLN